tara:strand:- start:398 stop:565 length:168 start_codon:yes stop_codon:yes gene_type:complete
MDSGIKHLIELKAQIKLMDKLKKQFILPFGCDEIYKNLVESKKRQKKYIKNNYII